MCGMSGNVHGITQIRLIRRIMRVVIMISDSGMLDRIHVRHSVMPCCQHDHAKQRHETSECA